MCIRDRYQTENVFIVLIDGVRFTEGFGEPNHINTPYMWNYLRPNGTVDMSFYNKGETKTLSGHASTMTGSWQSLPNDGSMRPSQVTLFELYRKQTGADSLDVWSVTGKEKLEAVSYSENVDYGATYRASFDCPAPEYNDTATWQKVQSVMDDHHPSLMMINLAEVDIDGHSGDWNEYVRAIQGADKIVYDLWNKIQSDPIYKDKTTMIVTNDHGRHLNGTETGWKDHGCDCIGCQRLMFMALGPDIKVGEQLMNDGELIDITPTVGVLLDLDMPYTLGEPMLDILTHPPNEDPSDDTGNGDTTGDGTGEASLFESPVVLMLLIAVPVVLVLAAVMAKRKKGGAG